MDFYAILKFIHVVAAILWVGGGFTLLMTGVTADRAGDTEGTIKAMQSTARLGGLLMMPSSLVTLLTGLAICWFWLGFSDLWILIGLAGFTATFLVGIFFFKPVSERLAAMVEAEGVTPTALALGRRIMQVARFDYAIMLVIVADMVLKPAASDIAVLAVFAAIALVGVWAGFIAKPSEKAVEAVV